MTYVWIAILLAGVGTFFMRAAFILAAHRISQVPPWADRVLRQIPPAALAALVAPALLRPNDALEVLQPRLWAGLFAGFIAWKTKNTGLTLALGLLSLTLVELVV